MKNYPSNKFLSEAFAYALGYWQGRARGQFENETYENMTDYHQLLYKLGYESGVADYCRLDKEQTIETEFDDLDDEVEYCVYCYEPIVEWKMNCCGENHFLTGFQIKEHERDLVYIDKRMKGASQ